MRASSDVVRARAQRNEVYDLRRPPEGGQAEFGVRRSSLRSRRHARPFQSLLVPILKRWNLAVKRTWVGISRGRTSIASRDIEDENSASRGDNKKATSPTEISRNGGYTEGPKPALLLGLSRSG